MIDFERKWCYNVNMIFEERLDVILDTLNKEKKISNKDLIKKLEVSESTLRRDLDYLVEDGKIKRVHGGAVLNIEPEELSFDTNELTNPTSKREIAKKAASLVEDKMVIFLDGGSTCNLVIDYLRGKDIRVVTHGLMHMAKLMENNIPTTLLGGDIKVKTKVNLGLVTLDQLSNYSFDIAFLGANGYDKDYYYTADINEAILKKTAAKLSEKAYILADSSKENLVYHAKICKKDECELIREDK